MAVNISRGAPIKYYSSDRISSLLGNGLLTFIHEKYYYQEFFNKKEIVTYKNTNDLVEKILKYKKDDQLRKKIARNGRSRYFKLFNSTIVADYIISKTFGIENKYLWEN